MDARVLGAGDEGALEAFLAGCADVSMFLRSNLRRFGIRDEGQPLQGRYAALEDGGLVRAAAAHYRNGMLVVAAPPELAARVCRTALSGDRALSGFAGPAGAVRRAKEALATAAPVLDEVEDLFTLELVDLRVPASLATGAVSCRHPAASETALLVAWRAAYHVEALHATDGEALVARCRGEIAALVASGDCWVASRSGEPVAFTAFNARLPEIVQVGGVYTPPALRGRGHARAAVAGSLLEARAGGAARAVLFTSNPAACRSYEALGFTRTGAYALVLFQEGVSHAATARAPERDDAA